MLDWKSLVYTGKCGACGYINRYIIIIPSSPDSFKAKDLMAARLLLCKSCGERVKARKESPPLPAGFLGKDELTSKMRKQCFFKTASGMRRRILTLTPSAYKISIDLNELSRAGFLGVVTVRVNEVNFIYHFLENGITPIYKLDARREALVPGVVSESQPEEPGISRRRILRRMTDDVPVPEEEEE